jgi:hypothetical protein
MITSDHFWKSSFYWKNSCIWTGSILFRWWQLFDFFTHNFWELFSRKILASEYCNDILQSHYYSISEKPAKNFPFMIIDAVCSWYFSILIILIYLQVSLDDFWMDIRLNYMQILDIVELANTHFSSIIFISCFNNFYFICYQLISLKR